MKYRDFYNQIIFENAQKDAMKEKKVFLKSAKEMYDKIDNALRKFSGRATDFNSKEYYDVPREMNDILTQTKRHIESLRKWVSDINKWEDLDVNITNTSYGGKDMKINGAGVRRYYTIICDRLKDLKSLINKFVSTYNSNYDKLSPEMKEGADDTLDRIFDIFFWLNDMMSTILNV